jgi:hypothetical protein
LMPGKSKPTVKTITYNHSVKTVVSILENIIQLK